MKIMHVLTRLLRAGSEENTLLTCVGQLERGHDVHLVHGHGFDARYYAKLPPALRLIEVKSLTRAISPRKDLNAFAELVRIFRRMKPDVVHTHQSKAGILGRFAAAAARVPSVVHGVHIAPFQNVSAMEKGVYVMAEKAAGAITHAYIDVSRGMREAYLAYSIGRNDEHFVIHSGFDLGRFRKANWPEDWRRILGIDATTSKPPTVVMLAALEERKRHLELLEHLRAAVAIVPDLRVLFAGEGHLRACIEARIVELGLTDNVRLLGFRTDPERIVAIADVCTLSSTREGLPRAIVQYLAAGKPMVVSDLPGLSEIVTNGVNGLVMSPNNLFGLVHAIADLLLDEPRRESYSAGAIRSELGSWDAAIMTQQIEKVYANLVQRRAAPAAAAQ